jgi:hypothetical protein
MADRWSGTIARLGVPTGDGRIIAPSGVSHRALPLPLSWQRMSNDGHLSSVVVGRIDSIDFDYMAGEVRATGVLLDEATTPEVAEVRAMLANGVVGPSVDPGAVDYDMLDDYSGIVVFTRYEIAGATLVSVPAFAGLGISLDDQVLGEPHAVVAAVRSEGWCDLPVADRDAAWDGAAAAQRVAEWAGLDGDNPDWSRYGRAFLWRNDDANPETRSAYGLGMADIVDGELTLIPRGVFAVAAVLQGARGGVSASQEEQDRMRSVVSGIYDCADLGVAPWDTEQSAEAAMVSGACSSCARCEGGELAAEQGCASGQCRGAVTACAQQLPPLAWFDDPGLPGPTPLTITADGQVWGHCALWDSCHVGLPGCVTPPCSMANYAYFTTGSTQTAEGIDVPVGHLTVGTGHATPDAGFRAAAEHYDHTGTTVAVVAAGEDQHGIWVAGAIVPEATTEQVEALRRSPLSGDWRRIGGNLELVAALAVNVPGFPVPRARVSVTAGGEQLSLVASARFDEQPESERAEDQAAEDTARPGRESARRRARARLQLERN